MAEYNDKVIQQLAAVRESGATNMFDKNGIRQYADMAGMVELVEFCDSADNEVFMEHLQEMGRRR